MNFTFLWCNEAMAGRFGAPNFWFSFFWDQRGNLDSFFVFSKMEGLKIPPKLLPEMVKGFGVAGERSGAPLPRRWNRRQLHRRRGVDGWMDGWMDGIDHRDSCASCRFHVLRVGSLWSQYSSTVGWRYFKEMVLSFGMTFENIVVKIEKFFPQMRFSFNHSEKL